MEAKRIGGQIKETDEWVAAREGVMREAVNLKFNQNPELAKFLMGTRDLTLHEATSDTFFGIGAMLNSREMRNKQYKGLNRLGAILEEKRADLNRAVESDSSQD